MEEHCRTRASVRRPSLSRSAVKRQPPPALAKILLPALRQRLHSQRSPQRSHIVLVPPFRDIQPSTLRHRHRVRLSRNHFELAPRAHFSLARHRQIKSRPPARQKSLHHFARIKSHIQFVARQPRLRHHHFRRPHREPVAQMRRVFRKSFRRKILPEDRCRQFAPGQFLLPVVVMRHRIAIHRLKFPAMHRQVCLPVAIQIQLAQRHPPRHRLLVNRRRHAHPVVHHVARQPRVHRNYLHLHPSSLSFNLSSRARPSFGRRGICCSFCLVPLPCSLRCHPERGRFLADEGPAVRFASFLCLLLYVVIPSEAAFWPTRDLLFVLLVFSFCFALWLRRLLPRRSQSRSLPRQVLPRRVCFLDKRYFFGPPPAFDFLFPPDCRSDVGEDLVMDQPLGVVSRRESGNSSFPVLLNSRQQIVRHSGVQAARSAGKYVDAVVAIHCMTQEWTQPSRETAVRGDDPRRFLPLPFPLPCSLRCHPEPRVC